MDHEFVSFVRLHFIAFAYFLVICLAFLSQTVPPCTSACVVMVSSAFSEGLYVFSSGFGSGDPVALLAGVFGVALEVLAVQQGLMAVAFHLEGIPAPSRSQAANLFFAMTADMRTEYFAALAAGQLYRANWLLVVHYIAIARALFVTRPLSAVVEFALGLILRAGK